MKAVLPNEREERRGKAGGWLRGAAVLGLAAVISKLLGTLQKIPLQNMAGDGVFGIYNAVYPLYILILFTATAGFPITVSKFVAERVAAGDDAGARRIVYVSSVLLSGTGLFFSAGLLVGADVIAEWIGISQTAPAIRCVSFALLFAPLMAVLRGYFQGYQTMLPTAVSQVVEQFVRVGTMVALLLYLSAKQAAMATIAAGATFGSVTGGFFGLLIMLYYWRKEKGSRVKVSRSGGEKSEKSGKSINPAGKEELNSTSSLQLAKQIAAYAIPICLGTIVVPLMALVDTFTMPRILHGMYGTEAEAMRQFGLYNRGLPLVQLVVMLASTLSAVLVPAIAAAKAGGDLRLVQSRAELAIRWSWYMGLAAAFGLAFTALPINVMLYRTNEATWTMAILAFTALFSTLNTVSGSVLQGLGAVRLPALTMLIAVVLKALGNVWLMPRWGIEGAALSAVIAFAAAAGLTLVQAARCTGVRFALRQYAVAPTLAVGVMGGCLAALQLGAKAAPAAWLGMPERWAHSAIALGYVGVGAAAYALALLRSGAISREELRLMPELDRKLTPVLIRLRLIPKRDLHK